MLLQRSCGMIKTSFYPEGVTSNLQGRVDSFYPALLGCEMQEHHNFQTPTDKNQIGCPKEKTKRLWEE
jgi:hypothetical protein